MKELIPINKESKTILASDLWQFLGKPYGTLGKWIDKTICDSRYAFIEGHDFFLIDQQDITSNKSVRKSKGLPRRELLISLEGAKILAMLSRTYQGYEAKRYFIDIEK